VPTNNGKKCSTILIARSPTSFSSADAEIALPESHRFSQSPAAQADVRAIVGQTDVGNIRQHDQIIDDDSGFAQFGNSVELAAAKRLMA
jgi:hypothetical protein